MTIRPPFQPPYSIFLQKKWGNAAEQAEHPEYGIYQMRKCRQGKTSIQMKFYSPTNPRTEPQQANRGKFGEAVAAYQILGTAERKEWKRKAQRKQMSGYNLFLRQYMLS